MKVFHIITGLGDGGAEGVLAQLCLSERENEHVVASMTGPGKYGPRLRSAGIRVHCLDMPPGQTSVSGLWKLFRLMRTEQPDVVQTWLYHADLIGGGMACITGSKPICWGIRTSNIDRDLLKPTTFFVAQQCARFSKLIPTLIISCSNEGARDHSAFGYASDRFRVIPNGCDIAMFRPDVAARQKLRSEWNIGSDDLAIGMVARFDPLKDHANLIAAMGRVRVAPRSLTWVLVGQGVTQQNQELADMLTAHNVADRVLLLGARQDIPAVMNALDIHVLASRVEGFPNVLAQAMACGTPCVATAVGDSTEIVGDSGWLVPPRDPRALAEAIERAVDAHSVPSWIARKQAARARICERFELSRMCESYRAAWAEAINAELS